MLKFIFKENNIIINEKLVSLAIHKSSKNKYKKNKAILLISAILKIDSVLEICYVLQ